MVSIILGFITLFISIAVMIIAFFMGAGAGMSGTQVGLIMLVALYGMYQSAVIMSDEID